MLEVEKLIANVRNGINILRVDDLKESRSGVSNSFSLGATSASWLPSKGRM